MVSSDYLTFYHPTPGHGGTEFPGSSPRFTGSSRSLRRRKSSTSTHPANAPWKKVGGIHFFLHGLDQFWPIRWLGPACPHVLLARFQPDSLYVFALVSPASCRSLPRKANRCRPGGTRLARDFRVLSWLKLEMGHPGRQGPNVEAVALGIRLHPANVRQARVMSR